jgi:pectinesterase
MSLPFLIFKRALPLVIAGLVLPCSISFAAGKKLTVASDGSGDFKTVQEAVAAVPDKSTEPVVIHLKAGTYEGPVVVPKEKSNVTLQGEGAEKTIITWDKNVNDPLPPGANKFNPGVFVEGGDFQAENLTIQNTSGDHGQALALRIDADRVVLKNCRLLGWQDTLMVNQGRQYFKECYIEGRVDFIYGNGTAVFDHCEIRSKNGGHITAASTPIEHPFGLVFLDCKLTGDPTPWSDASGKFPSPKPSSGRPLADLGRPWRPTGSVTYINCEMGDHIKPEGWNNWGKPENEQTARYAEYNSSGPGANPDKRVPWAKKLSKEEAEKISVQSVLAGSDNWKP